MDFHSAVFGAFMSLSTLVFLYDCALFALLRRQYLLWHALRALLLVVLALCAFGFELPYALGDADNRYFTQIVAADLSVAVLAPFILFFLEPEHSSGRQRHCLVVSTACALGGGTLAPFLGHWLINPVHNLLMGAALILILSSTILAYRRGSRSGAFLLMALAAGFTIAVFSLIYGIIMEALLPNWMLMIAPALALEFIITALALADRVLVLSDENRITAERMHEAIEANQTDPLTGLPNRRALEELFEARDKRPDGVALVDLDHFKSVNDRFGHGAGDDVLVAVGEALRKTGVFAARLGGEEFILVLYGKDWARQAERARTAIPPYVRHHVPEMLLPVTASAGLASHVPGAKLSETMKQADLALYAAKQAGRNQSLALTFFDERIPDAPVGPRRNAA